MCQEKKEEEDSPVMKIASTQQLEENRKRAKKTNYNKKQYKLLKE